MKPYPKTKPSGVEWLGDVPEHWSPQRVRFCYSIQLGKMLQTEPASPNDEETPYLKSQHVQWEEVRVENLPIMWASKRERLHYAVRDGDLLVCEGGDVGRAAIVREAPDDTIIQNALHRVRPLGSNEAPFLRYVLAHAASQGWFEIVCNRSTIAHFTVEKFGALGIALPPPTEQTAIAAYLDRETGRIDELVGKKRDLIERLKEKRTALISRTVTRGLPADLPPATLDKLEALANQKLPLNPPLKPSGIDWLGDVPEHWQIKKLSWLFRYAKGPSAAMLTKEYVAENGGDFPVFSGQTENNGLMGVIDWHEFDFSSPVVFVTTVGARAMSTRLVSGKFSLSQNCALIIPRSQRANPLFYEPVLRSLFDYERRSISLIMQPSLRFDDLDKFRVPLPPPREQAAIAAYLDEETAKLDALVAKVETAIERLQEYRTALITAAVTGKIDVRDAGTTRRHQIDV